MGRGRLAYGYPYRLPALSAVLTASVDVRKRIMNINEQPSRDVCRMMYAYRLMTMADDEKLIEAVRKRTVLYDCTDFYYRSKEKKGRLLESDCTKAAERRFDCNLGVNIELASA